MRRVLLAALCTLVCAGCTTYVPESPSRVNPAGTIEMLKKSAREQDYTEEWDILSPDLKTRLSERVGRNVDFADYESTRRSKQGDPEIRRIESMLQMAEVPRVVMHSPTRATAHLTGPMGQGGSVEIGMVRVELWELRVSGDPQPFDGIVGDTLIEAIAEPDGSYTVVMRDTAGTETMRMPVPADTVESYTVASKWYVDDLGDLESELLDG